MKSKKIILPLIFGLALSVYQSDALACSLKPSSSWYFSNQQLVDTTQTIFEGRVVNKSWTFSALWGTRKYKYTIDVVRALKGRLSKQTTLTLGSSDSADVTYGPDCSLEVALEEGKFYLIFLDSFNPYGYKIIQGQDDPWISTVENYLNKGKVK